MNNNQNFESLDIITIMGFIAQMQNIQKDNEEKEYIHQVIHAISDEIQKLHKENDKIEYKLDKILEALGENKNDFNNKSNERT